MTQEHIFGTDELTPELVRNAAFDERDGRVDASEVRTFLDRVASSLEVFLAGDAQQALRREFARNAEIAQQVLDAGQAAAEQLRSHATTEAAALLDEANATAQRARRDAEALLADAHEQAVAQREQLMSDLRDLHDRIGASLYRFERAIEAAPSVREPEPAAEGAPELELEPEPELEPAQEQQPAPAWTQLPSDAWTEPDDPTTPSLAPITDSDTDAAPISAFEVIEDEPLAPGEPLVDLREMHAAESPTEAMGAHDDARAEALLSTNVGLDLPETQPNVAPPAQHEPPALGSDWLAPAAPAETTPPAPAPAPSAPAPNAPAQPHVPASAPTPAPAASPDAMAVRQLILESLAAGQPRDAIEQYLREQLGFVEPSSLVDAALASAQPPS